VTTLHDALSDPHFAARGIFARGLCAGAQTIPALPVPVADPFRSTEKVAGYPHLGEANHLLSKAQTDGEG
jgi:alpha-methylacyl-CoA racemase